MKDKPLVKIFTGSTVEADSVHEYLEENNIPSLVRNHLQEDLNAGWVMSGAESAAEVFVSEEDFPNAENLVMNMIHPPGQPVPTSQPVPTRTEENRKDKEGLL